MIDRDWYNLDGDKIDLKDSIYTLGQEGEKVIVIGTDSQRNDKKVDFVTVIVVYTPGKGGRVFYTKERDPRTYNLRDKLIKEALMSIQVAWAISPLLPDNCKIAALHADVNSDITKGKSAKFEKEIAGMINGNGFAVVTKPLAWAASHVAEHLVKGRNKKDL